MNVIVLILFICEYLIVLAEDINEPKINNNVIQIQFDRRSNAKIPRLNKDDLPKSGPILPGHSLIRPAKTMLKSAVKFPHEDKNLVYGNLDNLGITFDKTNLRVLSNSFRKDNIDLVTLLKAFEQINKGSRNNTSLPLIFISKAEPKLKSKEINKKIQKLLKNRNQENSGNERISYSMHAKLKSDPLVPNKLKEITMKALNYIHNQDTIPIMKTTSDISEESYKKNKMIKNAINIITKGNLETRQNSNMKEKIRLKKKKRKELLTQKLLDARSKLEFDTTRDDTLREKSKRIQDFLNKHIPVMQTQSLKEDTPHERYQKVNRFLHTQVPGGMSRLSLDEKSQYIEDFLNNRIPVFVKADSYKRQRKIPSFFKGRDIVLTNAQALKGLNSTVQALISGQKIDEDEDNNANEIIDRYSQEKQEEDERTSEYWLPETRRNTKKYRKRDSKYESRSSGDSDVSASSDYEKNPGNPYTIHKNKYVQNWMWNHFMDGDHMNINPFGPPFASLGPTGADLFFGRKWWYFNQDDYKPMG